MFNLEMAQDMYTKLYQYRDNPTGINVHGLYKQQYKEDYGDTVRHFVEKNFMEEPFNYTKVVPDEVRYKMTHPGIRHYETSFGKFGYEPDMSSL